MLLDLDMQPIRDNQAKKLSGGQKRRLSVGVAVLGNPKVSVMEGSPTWCHPIHPRVNVSCQTRLTHIIIHKMQKLLLGASVALFFFVYGLND